MAVADLTPAKGIDVCRCICHDPHGPVGHIRPCCINWNGPLHGEVGRAQELIEARALREERARALRNRLVPGGLAQHAAVAALHDALHDAIERTIADNYADTAGGYLVAPWAVAALATRAAMAVLETHRGDRP